jgi:hypothetical protein
MISVIFKRLIFLVFTDFADPTYKLVSVLIGELIGADFTGRLGTEKLVEINLTTAQYPDDFRRKIQISPFVVMHFTGAGQTMHAEGREYEDLIRLQEKQPVIHPHIFTAADMNIKLKIIMAVELRDLVGFAHLIMCFIPLMTLLTHREKRRLRDICLPGSHDVPPALHCAEFAYIETRFI